MTTPRSYDPRLFKALSFHDATTNFKKGSDTPRAYLERCLANIAAREPVVKAFVVLNKANAQAAADASSARWKAGTPLSAIDGMPVAIKDLLETRDMPTDFGCAAYNNNQTHRDNAAVWALMAPSESGMATISRPSTRQGRLPGGCRRCRPAACVSFPPFAAPATCACGRCRRHNTWR